MAALQKIYLIPILTLMVLILHESIFLRKVVEDTGSVFSAMTKDIHEVRLLAETKHIAMGAS